MSISSVANAVLPWLTAALSGGPVGVAAMAATKIASAIGLDSSSTVEQVKNALTGMSPADVIKLKTVEQEFQKEMQELGYKNEQFLANVDLEAIKTVNATMQVELLNSANEAWYQKAWRPANGFAVAAGSYTGVVFTCILFSQAIYYKDLTALNAIPQLAMALAAILAVPGAAVGITAWKRSVEKLEKLKQE